MQLLFTGFLDSREGYFPPCCILTSKCLSLLISFVILLPTTRVPLKVREILTLQSQAWRALWAVPNMLRKGRTPKTSAYSVLLCVVDAPSETYCLYSFWTHCPTHIWWGGEIPDTITILWFYKDKWLHITESSSFMSVPRLWEFLQGAFSTYLPSDNTHTSETFMYDPDIWEQLLLKLAVNLEMQTREKLCFCYSPDYLTGLSPLTSLPSLRPAPQSQFRAICSCLCFRACCPCQGSNKLVVNQDTEKLIIKTYLVAC